MSFLLCVIYIFGKLRQVALLKDKKDASIVNVFQSILDSSKRKRNKIWVDEDSEFYNSSMNHGQKKMIQKYIERIMKENLLLIKDSSEP